MSIRQELEQCDLFLKNGDLESTRSLAEKLAKLAHERSDKLTLARICRRSGLLEDGLKLLVDLVRGNGATAQATPSEISEYAMLLAWNGSHLEGLRLLDSLPLTGDANAHMDKAFCHILRWDYQQAIVELSQATAKFSTKFSEKFPDPYRLLVAKVNLASAYLNAGNLARAEELCGENIDMAKRLGANRLLGNCLEIRSQVGIHLGKFDNSEQDLKEAEALLEQAPWDKSFITKWRSFGLALRNQTPNLIEIFRAQAIQTRQWESVRDSDFFLLKLKFSQDLLDRLVVGTPYPAFRERVEREFGTSSNETFLGERSLTCFDPTTGKGAQDPGRKICALVSAIARDLYAPAKIGEIFASIYPDQFFDVHTSPGRIRQLISRTRQWMDQSQTGFSIQHEEGCYRLEVSRPLSIRLRTQDSISDDAEVQLNRLALAVGPGEPFSSQDAARILAMSSSHFSRFAKILIDRGQLKRTGAGRLTRYKLIRAAA